MRAVTVIAGAGQQQKGRVLVQEGRPWWAVVRFCFHQRFYFKNPMAAENTLFFPSCHGPKLIWWQEILSMNPLWLRDAVAPMGTRSEVRGQQ